MSTTQQQNIESETLLSNNTETTERNTNQIVPVSNELAGTYNDANLQDVQNSGDSVANSASDVVVPLNDERTYVIKKHIVPVLIFILCLITLHYYLSIILSVVYLLHNYLFTLFTLFAVFISVLISSCVVYTWENITCEANFFRRFLQYEFYKDYVLHELTKYKYYKECTKCVTEINHYKEQQKQQQQHDVEKYKIVVRKIEDLRYFTLTNALLYSITQLLTQVAIIIYQIYFHYDVYSLPLQIVINIISVILLIMCGIIFRSAFCDFINDLGIYRVSIFTYLMTLMSVSLYIFDIGFDIFVASKYMYYEHYIRGTVTFMFIIIPGILGYWFHCETQHRSFTVKKTNILTMLLNLEPVIGYRKSVNLLKQTRRAEMTNDKRNQKDRYLEYVRNNLIVARLRLSECETESCPQIIIQLSFLFLTVNFSQLTDEKLHIVNIISSVISVLNVAVSLVLVLRSALIDDFEEDPFPIQGMIIHFLANIPVASRLISLSFLASQHPYWTFLAMFVHWFIIMLCITYAEKEYNIPKLLRNGFTAIMFTYTTAIIDAESPEIYITFQVIFFVENIAAMIFWSLSKFGAITFNGILILIGTVVVPSVIGWICKYFYKTYYEAWINEFEENRNRRLQPL